jgi:hypothetical protein
LWLLRARSAQTSINKPITMTRAPRTVYCPWPLIPDPCNAPVPWATHTAPTRQSTTPTIPRTHTSNSDPQTLRAALGPLSRKEYGSTALTDWRL